MSIALQTRSGKVIRLFPFKDASHVGCCLDGIEARVAFGDKSHVRYWPKADMLECTANVRFRGKADMACAGHLHQGVSMSEINTKFLFTIALEIQVSNLGDTPCGRRRIFHFDAGRFEGPKLEGRVLPGAGGGWSLIRRDDVMEVDVPLTLETDDKHQIYMAWKRLRHGPKEVMDRLYRGSLSANARTLDVFQVL
jgi:Protein of unknown function (DUF3237)